MFTVEKDEECSNGDLFIKMCMREWGRFYGFLRK